MRDAEATDRWEHLRARFAQEVKELWTAAKSHWDLHAPRLDSASAERIESGRYRGPAGAESPAPLLAVLVSQGDRTRAQWQGDALTPVEGAIGFKISGWFALCAPGELRELADEYDIEGFRPLRARKVARSYLRAPSSETQMLRLDGDDSHRVLFVSPVDGHDILLRCGSTGPIEVFEGRGDSWRNIGTLRQHVVEAVAALLNERSPGPTTPG